MNHSHLTLKNFLGFLLWCAAFMCIPGVLTKALCQHVILPLLLPAAVDSAMQGDKRLLFALPLFMVLPPFVAIHIGFHVGLKVTSRYMTREQMYGWLIGRHPTTWSRKYTERLLSRLY